MARLLKCWSHLKCRHAGPWGSWWRAAGIQTVLLSPLLWPEFTAGAPSPGVCCFRLTRAGEGVSAAAGAGGTQLVSSCLVRCPKAFGRAPCTAVSLSRLLLLALFALWIPSPPRNSSASLSLFMRDSGPFSTCLFSQWPSALSLGFTGKLMPDSPER